jgi:hypothetical protein
MSRRRLVCLGLSSACIAGFWACSARLSGDSGGSGAGAAGAGGVHIIIPTTNCPDAALDAAEGASAGAAGESGGPCVPVRERSYPTEVAPVLATCGAGETCHSAFGSPNGLLAQAIDIHASECCSHPVLVTPGHPEASYILNKVRGEGVCAGGRMPPPAPLSAEQIQILSDWICEGAPLE